MLFNSLHFAIFFSLVWLGVLVLGAPFVARRLDAERRRAARNALLLVASYLFYGYWDWRFLSLIALSTAVDYVVARRLEPLPDSDPWRKRLLLASVGTNLGLLAFFKYFGFFTESGALALQALGFDVAPPDLEIILPVGISFYTFQTLSYTIDVYRRRCAVEHSLLRFATYVAFFPQLVAGPIERAVDLLPQFSEDRPLRREHLDTGAWLIGWGLFKKVVIADNLAAIVDAGFALEEPTGAQALIAVYAFAWQIYCDFSGYTDVARGVARLMGFELSLNFDLPYFAKDPSDFWRRWHISLSSWLRDYLYISLGGNRKGPRRTYVNLATTMVLGGLWHGAAWTFVWWGVFHGVVLIAYRWGQARVEEAFSRAPRAAFAVLRPLNVVFFFHVVCVSWLLFRAESMAQAGRVAAAVASGLGPEPLRAVQDLGPVHLCASLVAGLWLVQLIQYRTGDHLFVLRLPTVVRALVYALGALLFLFVGEFGGAAFLYFQF